MYRILNNKISFLRNILKKKNPLKYFLNSYTSKWVILFIDLVIVSLCLIFSFSLLANSTLNSISILDYYKGLISVVTISLIAHLTFKPHKGVVRYTSIYDIKSVFFSSSLAFILNVIYIFVNRKYLQWDGYSIPYSVATINFILSTFTLVLFRLGIQYIFHLGKKNKKKPKIFIYGAGNAGQLTYNALISKYDIVAFIDDDISKKGKLFNGVKILFPDDHIHDLIKRINASEVILTITHITPVEKRRIVDMCMEWKLKIKAIPPIDSWINDQLTRSQITEVRIEDLLGRDVIKLDHAHLSESLKGQTILVTGAAGSIGSEISRQLLYYKPASLILLDHSETPLYQLEIDLESYLVANETEVKFIYASISDRSSMESVFKSHQVDWIFHAAAYKHVPAMEKNPLQAIRVNVLGTKYLADLAEIYLVKKMVLISTDKAVNPTNVMGVSKRIAEMYIQSKNELSFTGFITTRFGNVLGSNGSVIPLFKRQIKNGGPVTVTHKDVTRYFMTIPEACELVLEAGEMGEGGEIYVFDMGESVKIIDLARKMIYLSGLTIDKDIKIEITSMRPGEKLYEELLNDKELVMPTHHAKIKRAKNAKIDHEFLNEQLSTLSTLMEAQTSPEELVSYLKKLVPEYISKNSPFEKLDTKLLLEKQVYASNGQLSNTGKEQMLN